MPLDAETIHLLLQIDAGGQIDTDEVDRLTRQLRTEIQELGVGSVELVRGGAAPDGTKSAEAVMLGSLATAILPAAIPALIGLLQAWTLRDESRKVKIRAQVGDRQIEVEYSGKMSQAELKGIAHTLMASP